jgi:hypothetical protein
VLDTIVVLDGSYKQFVYLVIKLCLRIKILLVCSVAHDKVILTVDSRQNFKPSEHSTYICLSKRAIEFV